MANVVLVKSAPKELKDNESIVEMPDFKDHISQFSKSLKRQHLTTVNNLRSIITAIGADYDEQFSSYRDVNLSKFQGREFKDLDDLSAIILEVFNKYYPRMIDMYLASQIKKRKPNVEVVYFVGPKEKLDVFQQFGFTVKKNAKEAQKGSSQESKEV